MLLKLFLGLVFGEYLIKPFFDCDEIPTSAVKYMSATCICEYVRMLLFWYETNRFKLLK